MWPTATADDANNVTRDSGQFQSLTRVVRGQSTPQTWGTPQTVTDTNSTPGSLSPLWVEWLQGFPPEWTDCEASVTPSVLTRWRLRSRCWLRLLGYDIAP